MKRNSIMKPLNNSFKNQVSFKQPIGLLTSSNAQIIQQHEQFKQQEAFDPLQYVNKELNEKDILTIKMLYDYMVDDDIQQITPKNIQQMFKICGHTIPYDVLLKILSDYDQNEDGQIGFDEFIEIIITRPCDKDTINEIEDIFEQLDDGFKGYLDEQDLKNLALDCNEQTPSKEMMQMMLKSLNADSKGRVYKQQFVEFNKNRMKQFNLAVKNQINTYK